MWWKEPTTSIRGVGKKKAADLTALNIDTVGDLLEHYPRQESYLDFSKLKTIAELAADGSKQIFKATVHSVRDGFRGRTRFSTLTVRDETCFAEIYFFMGQRYWAKKFKPGTKVVLQRIAKVPYKDGLYFASFKDILAFIDLDEPLKETGFKQITLFEREE